jgi:hypothetical protein
MDASALTLAIKQVGARASRGVAGLLRTEGETIRDLAKAFAPVKDGYLENAIKTEAQRVNGNGRLEVYVYIDMGMPAADGKSVGDYALQMHEGLEGGGSGAFKLGPGSRLKEALTGMPVGGKFLERAGAERIGTIMARAQQLVRNAL